MRQQAPNSGPGSNQSTAVAFDRVGLVLPGGRALLSDISFSVQPGETLVLLGRSGCGKTTTLKLINRLAEPTSGRVMVDGLPTGEWDPIRLRRHIGYVIQETGLFPHFTVERNVGLVPALEKWRPDRIRARTVELLNIVGLDPAAFANRYPAELSGGQRQRVGVARALAADPPILLMDEPFGALDPITRNEIQREFAALARRLKKTIVFVTHDLREAFLLASRIALFKDGVLVETAAPADFKASSNPEARAFLDSLGETTE